VLDAEALQNLEQIATRGIFLRMNDSSVVSTRLVPNINSPGGHSARDADV